MVPGQKQNEQTTPGLEYYPFRLGQDRIGDPKRYAFLVLGKDEKRISTQGLVLNLFLKHRTKIISQWGYLDETRHEFVLCLTCDMRNADITPDGLIVELRLLKFVRTARSIRMDNRLFDGFLFPSILLDDRVIILDSQIMFLIEHELKTPEEKDVLVNVGRIYAMDIVRQIRAKFSSTITNKVLYENVLDYFKAAGIGRVSLVDIKENAIQAIIRDPPVSERGGATSNHFVQGIIIGLIETFQDRETTVAEELYDANASRLFMVLLDKKNISSAVQPSEEMKIRALEEVQKVISSIDSEKKPQVEVPVLALDSSATLNQVLKTYESEGWIGGKIGYTPESPKVTTSPPIVVRYEDGRPISETKENGTIQSDDMLAKTKEESSKEVPKTPPKDPKSPRKKISKEEDTEEDDDEDRLASVLNSVSFEDEDYFGNQSFLE